MSERGSLEGNILIVAMSKIQWQWGRFINSIDWFYRQTRGMKSGMICPSQWKRFTCCGKGMSMHMTTKRTHHHHQAKSDDICTSIIFLQPKTINIKIKCWISFPAARNIAKSLGSLPPYYPVELSWEEVICAHVYLLRYIYVFAHKFFSPTNYDRERRHICNTS